MQRTIEWLVLISEPFIQLLIHLVLREPKELFGAFVNIRKHQGTSNCLMSKEGRRGLF